MLVHFTFGPVKRGTNEPPSGGWRNLKKKNFNSNKTWVMEDAKHHSPHPLWQRSSILSQDFGFFLPS
jgi:hypothetical protein